MDIPGEGELLLTEAEDTAEHAVETVVAEVSKVEQAVRRGIEAFLDSHLRNSSFSQDTPAWNHFQAGIPALTEHIVHELEG